MNSELSTLTLCITKQKTGSFVLTKHPAKMRGIELSGKILELDANVKICLVTAGESNIEVLRELYPQRNMGCYINKPVTIENLVRRVRAELDF